MILRSGIRRQTSNYILEPNSFTLVYTFYSTCNQYTETSYTTRLYTTRLYTQGYTLQGIAIRQS